MGTREGPLYTYLLMPTNHRISTVEDVCRLLLSRHGIQVTPKVVEDLITTELAGDPEEQPKGCVDLRQLVGILLIPDLKRALHHRTTTNVLDADSGTITTPVSLFHQILHIILTDIGMIQQDQKTTTNTFTTMEDTTTSTPALTIELIQTILAIYGETNVPTEVLKDMIRMCGNHNDTLTADALSCALTSDLTVYQVEWNNRLSTYYDDVMSADDTTNNNVSQRIASTSDGTTKHEPPTLKDVEAFVVDRKKYEDFVDTNVKNVDTQIKKVDTKIKNAFLTHRQDTEDETIVVKPEKKMLKSKDEESLLEGRLQNIEDVDTTFKKVFTFPTIDQTAEGYRSQTFAALLWVTGILCYFAYVYSVQTAYSGFNCDDFNSNFGCKCANGIANWIYVFLQLTILGTSYIVLSSSGNSIYAKRNIQSVIESLVGMTTIILTTIVAFFVNIQTKIFDTTNLKTGNAWAFIISLLFGCFLLAFQVMQILRLIVPQSVQHRFEKLHRFLTPGMAHKELRSKQAAAFKVEGLINNALDLHQVMEQEPLKGRKNSDSGSNSVLLVSSQGRALMNYTSRSNLKETVGGFSWAWKRFFNSTICSEYGVWFHSRLLACNFGQFLVLSVVATLVVAGSINANTYLTDQHNKAATYDMNKTEVVTWRLYFTPSHRNQSFTVPLLLGSDVAKYFALDMMPAPNTTGAWFFNSTGAFYYNYNEISTEARDLYNLTVYSPPLTSYPVFRSIPELVQRGVPSSIEQLMSATLSGLFDNRTVPVNFGEREIIITEVVDGMNSVVRTLTGLNLTEAVYLLEKGIFTIRQSVEMFVTQTANSIPTSDAFFSILVGGFAGFAAILGISLVFIPSYISTVLKFRSGVIPTLTNKDFLLYRASGDQATILFGSCVWAAAFCGVICALLIGFLFFILIWDVTSQIVQAILGQIVGICVTIGLKMIIMIFLRKMFVAAYYRKRPAASNVMNVVLESWNVGLSTGFMIGRSGVLLLCTAFYIGRLDTPFLAPGVGFFGPVPLDSYPNAFRKDILLHEAHRHPYIERLASLYLLKLRFPRSFGSRAGGVWRLIVVSALCPWLRKYRADIRDEPIWDEAKEEEQHDKSSKKASHQEIQMTISLSREEILERELSKLRFRVQKLAEVTGKLSRKIQSLETENADLVAAATEQTQQNDGNDAHN